MTCQVDAVQAVYGVLAISERVHYAEVPSWTSRDAIGAMAEYTAACRATVDRPDRHGAHRRGSNADVLHGDCDWVHGTGQNSTVTAMQKKCRGRCAAAECGTVQLEVMGSCAQTTPGGC